MTRRDEDPPCVPLHERMRLCAARSRLLPPEMGGPGDCEMEDWADEAEGLSVELEIAHDEVSSLKAELEGAIHNRFYDQRDAYFEGLEGSHTE